MDRQYERPTIQRAGGYVPGEQPDEDNVIKLNTNENPYAPSPTLAEVLSDFDVARLRRYPQPTALSFRNEAARLHDVPVDSVVATNGGDELLRLVFATFVEPGEKIGYANPSYSLYPVLAELHGAEIFNVDLTEDWRLPEDFAGQMNRAGGKVAFVVNPHAPSGALLPSDEIARLADALDGVLLLDEAYVDFVDPETGYNALPLIQANENIIILRSLSKGYSLAGLRYGYGIGSPGLIAPMQNKTKDSYNTDVLSQLLATAALADQDYAAETWRRVRAERETLRNALRERGFEVEPSHSNFLLARIAPEGELPAASEIYNMLKDEGILVRYFGSDPRLVDCLRISIGTPEENIRLLTSLDAMAKGA